MFEALTHFVQGGSSVRMGVSELSKTGTKNCAIKIIFFLKTASSWKRTEFYKCLVAHFLSVIHYF